MNSLLVVLLAASLQAAVGSTEPWQLRLLNQTQSARCLDGSSPGYYFHRGADTKSFVFHLQGGGWCYNETSCGQRSLTQLGSSKTWPATTTIDFALFSLDPEINPLTYNWTSIFVQYCSGDSFAGHRDDPVPTPNGKVFMRGRDILDEVLMDTKRFLGMGTADKVIVGGCSAGGLSAYLHVDKIRGALPQVRTVKAVADAGFFIDAETVTDVLRHRQLVQYESKMFNISGGVNPGCVAQYGKEDGLWHCLMAQYTLPHVKTPTFLFNSMYDTYQLQNYFAPVWLPGVNPDWAGCIANSSDCNFQQQALIRTDWREQFITALRNSGMLAEPATSAVGHGAFAHGCFLHCGLGTSEYVNLTIEGVSLRDAISQWFYEIPDPAGGSYIHLDAPWPGNPYCPA